MTCTPHPKATANRGPGSGCRGRPFRRGVFAGLLTLLVSAVPGQGQGILGRAPAHPVASGSMVLTIHPFIDTSKYERVSDDIDGGYVRFSQAFVALFQNSYSGESWIFGIERHWGTASWGFLEVGAGYRAGIVTGYDEQLIGIARHTPILPVGGVVGWIYLGPVGGNVFWAYRAISLELTARCC